MKSIVALLFLATLAHSMPRYIIVPINDYYVPSYRMARAAWPQEGPGPAFAIPDNIRAAEEQIAAGRYI